MRAKVYASAPLSPAGPFAACRPAAIATRTLYNGATGQAPLRFLTPMFRTPPIRTVPRDPVIAHTDEQP